MIKNRYTSEKPLYVATIDNLKISIIMPVYKIEAYVGKAIESILAQTTSSGEPFVEWEFLIVDDGSPDKTGEICDSYAELDSRIQVIHQKNMGAASARNTAITLASGKYLYFLDGDDWCEPTMLSDLYELAEKYRAQLVISGFYIDTYYDMKHGRYITDRYTPKDAVFQTKKSFRNQAYELFDQNMLYSPWNKLYLRSYIIENKLFFPKTLWDDFPFVLSVIREIERVCITQKEYYHFLRARTESETSKYVPNMYEKREEEHLWMVELYQSWNLWEKPTLISEKSREMISRRYIDRLIGCFENIQNDKCKLSYLEKYRYVKDILNQTQVIYCLKYAKPRSLYSKWMYLPIKWKWPLGVLLEAKVISYVKRNNIKLFTRFKKRR